MTAEDAIKALRDALAVTPENLPLRLHLADSLLKSARYDDAVAVCKEGLRLKPAEPALVIGLARAFSQAGRVSEALVLLEGMTRPSAEAHLMRARLLLREGNTDAARAAYRRCVEADPKLADNDLSSRLGVSVDGWREDDERERTPAGEGMPQKPTEKAFERPEYGFKHVGGMESVKEQIRRKIIQPLLHPEIYQAYGKKTGGGILLYGPPGCGKTHIARATAGEVKAGFFSVGISDVLNLWIGESEKNLHALFEQARENAPCVLFFDEVDALGASRTDMRQSAGRNLINQFLSELDGIGANNEGVLVLAATNAPWHLDSAFRRPGRFDRIIFVPPPDEPARAEILRIQLKGKPVGDIDFDTLAKKSKDFSGADLKACVDEAVDEKLEQALASGAMQPVTGKELLRAVKQHKATTKEWFATARNYALYSNQGGHYDDIIEYLKLK
jgi:transitional endoplasmic reticulum ATPase